MHKLQEMVRLRRQGVGAHETARLLGISPNTERKWRLALCEKGLLEGDPEDILELSVMEMALPKAIPPQQVSTVSALEARIEGLWAEGAMPKAIHDRLRMEDPDFRGSLWAVKRLCARLDRDRGPVEEDVAIRVETAAGQVAQVDFGEVRPLLDPKTGLVRRAWVFVMLMGHSRHAFVKVVFDQRTETWVQLHIEAFAWFGGVPAVIVPDNLKAAVLRAAFGPSEEPSLSRSYRELARHYGFRIDPAPPYAPKKKGKVERSVRYVKENFFSTVASGESVGVVNRDLRRWCLEIAGERIHGTTGRKPLEMFEAEERAALRPLPVLPYIPITWKQAMVHKDSHIQFDGRFYSVPWRNIGATVWVRATPDRVEILDDRHTSLHVHDRRAPGRWSTVDGHLPAARAPLRHRDQATWEARAGRIGPECRGLVADIYASDSVLLPIRKVQAIVAHLESFPAARAEAAAARARAYAAFSLPEVRNILKNALDLQPIESALFPVQEAPASTPRFARSVQEILANCMETL